MRVVLGEPEQQPGDLVVLPARRTGERDARTVLVEAPRWAQAGGSEHRLAQAYRAALAAARERGAQSLVLPSALVLGFWPLEDVTRVALTVLMSTPSPARQVTIAVPTPAVLEIWAEALAREP